MSGLVQADPGGQVQEVQVKATLERQDVGGHQEDPGGHQVGLRGGGPRPPSAGSRPLPGHDRDDLAQETGGDGAQGPGELDGGGQAPRPCEPAGQARGVHPRQDALKRLRRGSLEPGAVHH